MFTFRPAARENVSLLIGLAGGTGSGKTFTADRLAAGMSGDKAFAVIDTESRRALHYADTFRFDHAELRPPFCPSAYEEAILAADAAGYPVIVVDQLSSEHVGEGGLLEMHEAELDRMAGDDWKKREAVKMAAWIKPKMAHKHMVQRLLQVRAHLILCFRAEEKVDMVRDDKGKMQIVPKKSRTGLDGWLPVCEKSLPYELTCSFLLTADAPGVPKPIKLQEQHRHLFPFNQPITEESGQLLAQWAAGGTPKQDPPDSGVSAGAPAQKAEAQTPEPARTGMDNQKLSGPSSASSAPYTDEQIITKLSNAKDEKSLSEAADLARGIKDKRNQERASAAYKASLARLREGAAA